MTFEIDGQGAYSQLKFEGGVHRVQRVPVTELSGRIQTSTATVAVLPEVEEVEVELDENEIKEDIYHSSSAGGQNVQKVATAIRLTHMPTGIVVQCQDERSQLQNKIKARNVLRSRLYELQQQQAERRAYAGARHSQVGSGERSGKDPHLQLPGWARDRSPHQQDDLQRSRRAGRRHSAVYRRSDHRRSGRKDARRWRIIPLRP